MRTTRLGKAILTDARNGLLGNIYAQGIMGQILDARNLHLDTRNPLISKMDVEMRAIRALPVVSLITSWHVKGERAEVFVAVGMHVLEIALHHRPANGETN